jgi:hypothetical protein
MTITATDAPNSTSATQQRVANGAIRWPWPVGMMVLGASL